MAEDVLADRASMKEKAEAAARGARRIRRPSRWYVASVLIQARLFFGAHFQSLRLANEERLPADVSGPLIIYMNHPSWWDVLPMFLLQVMLLPRRVLYAPSEAVALSYGRMLPQLGFFPVEKGTLRGTRQFLKDCGTVLAQPDSVLCITPEGQFRDNRIRPIELERGLAALLSRTSGAITVVPLAIEYVFWESKRPELLTSWGEPIRVEDAGSRSIDEWQTVLTESLTSAMDELAELSQRRDAWRFRSLVQGRMGRRNMKGLVGDLKALSGRNK